MQIQLRLHSLPLRARLVAQYILMGMLGALMALSFAPFEWVWLQPVLLALLVHLSIHAAGKRQAFLLGFAFGMGQFLFGITYVFRALHEQGNMALWLSMLLFNGGMYIA